MGAVRRVGRGGTGGVGVAAEGGVAVGTGGGWGTGRGEGVVVFEGGHVRRLGPEQDNGMAIQVLRRGSFAKERFLYY